MSAIERARELYDLSDRGFMEQFFDFLDELPKFKEPVCPSGCQGGQPLEYDTFLLEWYCEFCDFRTENS